MGGKTGGRVEKIDILRGAAVLFMVWGHTIQYMSSGNLDTLGNEAFRFIYSFHMPLFMIVSGYIYKFSFGRCSVKELVVKRVVWIVWPCILWSSASYLFTKGIDLIQGEITIDSLLKGWLSELTEYWFLLAVAVCSLMLLPCKRLKGWKGALVQLPLIFLVRYLPKNSMILYMYPYFVCGFLANRGSDGQLSHSFRGWTAILMLLYPVLLLHYRTADYIYETGVWLVDMQNGISQIGIDVYRWLVGFCGIAFILIAEEALERNKGKGLQKVKDFFVRMGQSSLEVYLVQEFVFSQLIVRLLYHVPVNIVRLCGGELLFTYLFCPVIAVCLTGVIMILAKIIRKNKHISRMIIGR